MHKYTTHLKKYHYNAKKGGFFQLGFIVDSLAPSQISYLMTQNANDIHKETPVVNVSCFFSNHQRPCMEYRFAIFNAVDITGFVGTLVATSFDTAKLLNNGFRSKKMWYINDISFLEEQKKEDYDKILNDPEIVKFCRSRDHADKLIEIGFNIYPNIIQDFNIMQIIDLSEVLNVK